MKRLIAKFEIVLRGDLLNPFWWSRARRRARRYDVLDKVICRYLKKYLPAAASVKQGQVDKSAGDENIFMFWGFVPMPPLVDACIRSVRAHNDQPVILLDEKTLFEYAKLPDYVLKKFERGQMGFAHFADIARVELLHKYGGIWMDSTLFQVGQIPQNIIDSNFFMFVADKSMPWGYGGVQNFFIRARKGDYLLNAWRAMIYAYWRDEKGARIDYLVHQLLFKVLVENDPRAKAEFAKMPNVSMAAVHRLWKYRDMPFNKDKFDNAIAGTFVQKTTYRDSNDVIPGSFSDIMIRGCI